MSGTLFSKTPRRDSPRPPRIATSNEPQGDRSAPPPPSEGAWSCDEPYKFPMKSSKNSLEKCNEILERHDEKTYAELKEEINFLMVVAGLFLAIVAAFTIESYKFLQEDKQDTMSDLLVEIVRLLNDTSAQGKAQLPKPFTPKHHAIVVNQLWFLSMILSLIAVAMGTFCLQWISALSRGSDLTAKNIPSHQSLVLRQLRHDGLDGWGVRYAPEALLFIVQLSIGLFVCGLVYFLWNVSERTAIPTLVMTGIAALSLCFINLLPFLQSFMGAFLPKTLNVSQCPYKSPTSWFTYNAGIVLLVILEMFLKLLQRDWVGLRQSFGKGRLWLTGFDWKMYDWTCLRLRAGTSSALSYFELGLISALDRFPYEGEPRDVISSYLENLVPVFGSYHRPPPFRLPGFDTAVTLQWERASRIRVDFLSALILQHLARRHGRLAPQLLHRRVELYIRVKNSAECISSGDGSRLDVGQSLACPFSFYKEFDLELKIQSLRCVRHLIATRRFNDYDIMSAAVLIRSVNALPPLRHIQIIPDPESQGDYLVETHSNQPDPGRISSPPNDLETGGTESATHNTGAEDQSRASFEGLCVEVRDQLLRLRRSDFKDEKIYYTSRAIFGIIIQPGPESVRTRAEV